MSDRRVTDNDLAIIMRCSLEAAQWLSTAATQRGSPHLRDHYLSAMHSAMSAAEQARQIAERETISEVTSTGPKYAVDTESDT